MLSKQQQSNLNKLKWADMYQPHDLDSCILPPRIIEMARNFVEQEDMPHLLLVGRAGRGKTTLANVILEITNADYLYFSGSNGKLNIEAVRDDIEDFANTPSLYKTGNKFVFVDEADGLRQDVFKALRETMSYYKNIRFIMTANYLDAFSEAMQSRLYVIKYDFTPEETNAMAIRFCKRCIDILNENKVEFDPSCLLNGVIRKWYPDHRSILNFLQANKYRKIDSSVVAEINNEFEMLFDSVFNLDIIGVRQWITDHADHNTFSGLYKQMETYIPSSLYPEFIKAIGDKQAEATHAPSFELCVCSALANFMIDVARNHKENLEQYQLLKMR